MNNKTVVSTALKYIGEMETPNNSGFKNKEFEKRMKDVGWSKSLSWCAYFTELVWKEAYQPNADMVKILGQLFSGSATGTFKNFDINKVFVTDKVIPKVGALMIWRYGSGWQGHIGIVEKIIDENTVQTIEGNTNDDGNREGYEVARRTRKIKTKFSPHGLNFVGFIYPPTMNK